jgi:hypothetical protein
MTMGAWPAQLPLGDLALWCTLALLIWLVLTAVLSKLGVHAAAVVAAPFSWLLARGLLSGIDKVIQWAQHTVTTMIG